MRIVLIGSFALALAACSGNSPGNDGGTGGGSATGGGSGGGGGGDAGFSACGHPGDVGNNIGVGQYCTQLTDCPTTAQICSAFQNANQPPNLQSFFCVNTCNGPCDPPSVCGNNATCVCQAPGACGCVPNSCSALFPDAGVSDGGACPADAGTDGGTCDGGSDGGDGGC